METIGFRDHDHATCVAERIAVAEDYCAEERLRLTPVRRRVLEILLEGHKAFGAYEILDQLTEEGFGSQPPVAYRALDFLIKHGLVHKVERLNAYVACLHPGQRHFPAFMICRICDSVAEATSAPSKGLLGAIARDAGFQIEQTVVEAIGICPACINTEGPR